MHSRVSLLNAGQPSALTDFDDSEAAFDAKGLSLGPFTLTSWRAEAKTDALGPGHGTTLTGRAPSGLEKSVLVTTHDRYPELATVIVHYTNRASADLVIAKWINDAHRLRPDPFPGYWAYQGATYPDRRDWLRPIAPGFAQANDMGMNASDYGGGTPIVDVWTRHGGFAVGHLETAPKLVALPVAVTVQGAAMRIEQETAIKLAPGQSFDTLETFVAVHSRDFYPTLKAYRGIMADKGLKAAKIPEGAYEPIWCAWGYERDFNVAEILATIPKVKALGLKWVVLDDGWQRQTGDWTLDPKKFPRGETDMRTLTEAVHAAGLKAALWIAPLTVAPGSDALHDRPDMLLLDKDGEVNNVTWWNSFTLCPAYPKTIAYTTATIRRAMTDWGFDGLKLDGQHLNGVAPCYNKAHHHTSPNASVEGLQTFFKAIYDTALAAKPGAVVELCPCGTSYAFFNTPYMNQSVASDPLSSWQVRSKGKVLRGLTGDLAAFSGDHVELSDGGEDFASTVGIGAVLATKFTWPGGPRPSNPKEQVRLTPEREAKWKHWIALYNAKMLPKGEYRGDLYDIGFDKPEAHAIAKAGNMFYAFYAPRWDGQVELRGLGAGRYRVTDYVENRDLGTVQGPVARLPASFADHLLIEATPIR